MKKLLLIIFFIPLLTKAQVIFTADNANAGFTWSTPATVSGYLNGLTLLASKTGVSVASLATTNLTLQTEYLWPLTLLCLPQFPIHQEHLVLVS